MELPKRVDQHVLEDKSYKIFSNIIPDEWIVRDVTRNDYGIDCYVEVCSNNRVTGQLLSIQIKGTRNIHISEKRKIVTYYNIKSSTINYWNNLPTSVFFILIDLNNENIYFCDIKKYIRKNYESYLKEKLNRIEIFENHKLTIDNAKYILVYFNIREMDRIHWESSLSNFIINFERNIEFLQNNYNGDDFLPIEGKSELLFVNLYTETKFLVQSFNIEWNLKSLKEIIEEGQSYFGNSYFLYNKQITEFIENIIPIIKILMERIKETICEEEKEYWSINNYFLFESIVKMNFGYILDNFYSF